MIKVLVRLGFTNPRIVEVKHKTTGSSSIVLISDNKFSSAKNTKIFSIVEKHYQQFYIKEIVENDLYEKIANIAEEEELESGENVSPFLSIYLNEAFNRYLEENKQLMESLKRATFDDYNFCEISYKFARNDKLLQIKHEDKTNGFIVNLNVISENKHTDNRIPVLEIRNAILNTLFTSEFPIKKINVYINELETAKFYKYRMNEDLKKLLLDGYALITVIPTNAITANFKNKITLIKPESLKERKS